MEDIDIGRRIVKLREEKGIARAALARKSGISLSFLNSLERNDKEATTGTLKKICSALEITLADFFKEDSPITPTLPCEDVSSEELNLARKIKNLAPDKREIVETVIKVDEAAKNEQAAAVGK